MSGYITKKKDMRFQSVEALQQVVNVVNEAAAALDDPKRTIRESAIPEVLRQVLLARELAVQLPLRRCMVWER